MSANGLTFDGEQAFECDEPHVHIPAKHSPYVQLLERGIRSTWNSPDGFVQVQEFETGERYLHHPTQQFPVRL